MEQGRAVKHITDMECRWTFFSPPHLSLKQAAEWTDMLDYQLMDGWTERQEGGRQWQAAIRDHYEKDLL